MVLEAELLVEVRRNVGVLPALDRDGVHLHDPEHGDGGGSDEHEPPQRRQLDRAPEEVRGDAREVVSQRIEDRRRVGFAAERALRQHRVEEDKRREDERQRIDERGPEREAASGDRVARDPGERHGEQHLLPRGDQAERRALDAEGEEARHDRVVQRRGRRRRRRPRRRAASRRRGRPPRVPRHRRRGRPRPRVEATGAAGGGMRLAPARCRGLLRRPGAVAADGGEHQHGNDGTPGDETTHRNTSPRSGGRGLGRATDYGTRCPFVVNPLSIDAVRKDRHDPAGSCRRVKQSQSGSDSAASDWSAVSLNASWPVPASRTPTSRGSKPARGVRP